jgi:hypothetical protein
MQAIYNIILEKSRHEKSAQVSLDAFVLPPSRGISLAYLVTFDNDYQKHKTEIYDGHLKETD